MPRLAKYPKCKNTTCRFCSGSWQWKDRIVAIQNSAAYWYTEARKRLELETNAGVTDHSWSEEAQRVAALRSKEVRRYMGIED